LAVSVLTPDHRYRKAARLSNAASSPDKIAELQGRGSGWRW
jgi:hypothetical protein